jgi:hypothetical protein
MVICCKIIAMTDTAARSTSEVAPSPVSRRTARPSWLDLRLVLGVILVLAAVVLGAFVISSADKRSPVWALSHDVAAGTVLKNSDVRAVPVQLGATGERYLPTTEEVVGKQLHSALGAGELLPRAAIADPEAGITITVPVRQENSPPRLSAGDRITVWVATPTCRATAIVSGIAVQDVKAASNGGFGSSASLGVVLRLNTADAQRVVPVLDLDGAVLRIGVLSVGQPPDEAVALGACATARR